MSFLVDVKPSQRRFTVEAGEPILDAALRAGLNFPYGCRSGLCGSCKGRVLHGIAYYPNGTPDVLIEQELAQGYALFCQACTQGPLTVEVQEIGGADELAVKRMPARVERMERLAPDVMRVLLKIPAAERLQFLAGQYIDVLLKDGRRRSFSLANAPHDDATLELHVRHVEGGDFTGYVFEQMKAKDILRIEGPHGSFFLREELAKPIIFIAGGTGFAPIKAMVEHALAQGLTTPMTLYWGVRARRDLYLAELAQRWVAQHAHFRFVPVLSQPQPEDGWTGRTGLVHEAAVADHADMAAYAVYASGPPAMVTAAREAALRHGLAAEHFFSDAFEFQAPKSNPA